MDEKMFLEGNDISVSNSRFIVKGQTYAMSNVTSVKTGLKKANKGIGIAIGIIGLVTLLGAGQILWGVIITIIGVFTFIGMKDEYSVVLSTSSGENQALISKDKDHIESVVTALNESIVNRG